MEQRPLIAITMRLELSTGRFYLGRDYSEALERAGAIPIHLGLIPDAEYIRRALANCDGVLLPGSNTDVDPHLYGEEPHHELGTVIPEKDLTDRLVLDEVERRGIPLLGICYGMQALNVYRGGTLHQDLKSQVPDSFKHEQGMPAHRNSHGLRIDEQSILRDLAAAGDGSDAIRVNSSHHQAIKTLGSGLVATAWAMDGIIECIEGTERGRFTVGVQWHPELTSGVDPLSKQLFAKFVSECRQYARTKSGS